MVVTGHLGNTPADMRAALVNGATPLPSGGHAPQPPNRVVVPGHGRIENPTHAELVRHAGFMLAYHRPDGPLIAWRRWRPAYNTERRCRWCRCAWPCAAAEWAEPIILKEQAGWVV